MFLLDALPILAFPDFEAVSFLVIGMERSHSPRIRERLIKEKQTVKVMQLPGGPEGPSSRRWLATRGLVRRGAKRDQAL